MRSLATAWSEAKVDHASGVRVADAGTTNRFRSSNAMPREVREAIAWCISVDGAGTLSSAEAEAYVDGMFDGDRGGEESW